MCAPLSLERRAFSPAFFFATKFDGLKAGRSRANLRERSDIFRRHDQ
jgi:hypothetical protein